MQYPLKTRVVDFLKRESQDARWVFKVLLLGNLAVGKTSLLIRFVEGRFHSDFGPTIGANFMVKKLTLKPKTEVDLQIWDISGAIKHQPKLLTKAFYQGASGVFLVFDLTRPDTLQSLEEWKREVEQCVGPLPMISIGNKNDLSSQITDDEIMVTMKRLNVIEQRLTSAKTGEGVSDSFITLASELLRRASSPSG